MRNAPNRYDSQLLLNEDFRDSATVTGRGATLGGTVSFNKGMTVPAASGIYFSRPKGFSKTIGGDFTAVFDVITPATVTNYRTLCRLSSTANQTEWEFGFESGTGKLYFYSTSVGVVVVSNAAITSGRHTLTLIVTGASVTLYIDGVFDKTTAGCTRSTGYPGLEGFLSVGCAWTTFLTPLISTMYSIKIYSKAFTADEVLDDYQSDQYREVTPENALLWLPFRSQYDVAGVRVSDNLGKATGAPATVTMGDGTTSTTFPTQLSGGGISFDGGDYVDTTYVPIFTYNTPFTFAFVMRKNGQMPGTDSNIFATSDAAQSLKGMMVPQFGPYAVTWLYQTGTYYYKITHSDRLLRPLDAYVVVYDPTALFRLRSWVNGVETGIYGLANSNADFNSGKSLLIGARHNGAAKTAYSPAGVQVLFAACFPFALTPTQARYLHSLMIRRAI